MRRITLALAGLAIAIGFIRLATAAEQFVPANFYWVGPYAAGGSGFGGGIIDYFQMLDERDGGINGVKITWEKCETEYNNARGVECYERSKRHPPTGATVIHPLSTGITYSLIEKATADHIPIISMGYGRTDAADGRVFPYVFPLITTYWSQADTMIKFIGQREGGMNKLKGKKIVLLYHDSAYGKEPHAVLDKLSQQLGFELTKIAVPHPGNEQQSQWLEIRRIEPHWVILWGWGVMNPTAIKAAAKIGFPRDHMIGVWWAGAEEDVVPAGNAAKGYIAAGFNLPGTSFPVMQDIIKYDYDRGKGDLDDKSRIGSIYHTRGVVAGIITAEAIRNAQQHFRKKGKSITPEEMRWGIENLNLTEKRLEELGAVGLMQPLHVTCDDHEGGGAVKYLQWDGDKWNVISDWISADKSLIRPMIEASAAKYAEEKGIKPRNCSKTN